MTNRFCRLLGIDTPIVQAPMGGASCPALAAAVTTLRLVSPAVRAVPATPVMPPLGIAHVGGFAPVLALAESGAWIGTRSLAAQDAAIHPPFAVRLLAAPETDPLYTELFDFG